MPFDQNPDDDYEHYQCGVCGGSVRLNKDETMRECDTCDLQHVNIKNGKAKKKQ